MKKALALLAIAACGHKKPEPDMGKGKDTDTGSGNVREQIEGGGGDDEGTKPDPDAIRIAAIERAMNALAPVANQCWAAGAAGDFHLAGTVKMLVSFDQGGRASAKPDEDTTKNAVLTDCLARVLTAYAWPKDVMSGQAIELPFAFSAPSGQNTIDRRLVPVASTTGAQVQVLLDAQNDGNAAASMFELALDPGAKLPPARATRDEVVIFLDDGELSGHAMHHLDAAYLAKGAGYALGSASGGHVLIVAVPGGTESAVRGGALPDPPGKGGKAPELHPIAKAKKYPHDGGAVTILVEGAPHVASAELLEMDAHQQVPTHAHEHETELLYVLSGSGTMTVDGVDLPVGPTTVIQIPPGTPHSFTAAEAVTSIQLYAPPGPEQRFKKMK